MKTKETIRKEIWDSLQKKKVARFPGAQGRIPNFFGAEKCARLLDHWPQWKRAKVIKCNPDSPQRAIRQKALQEGKIVYMAVPRLRSPKPFIELDPSRLRCSPYQASSIKGAARYGRPVRLHEVKEIDLVVCGSVAVNRAGARVGKGGGYSDLEYGLLREEGKIHDSAPVFTSVHPLQIARGGIPMTKHDIPLDAIVTPKRLIETDSASPRPKGVYWEMLTADKIDEIPVLKGRKPTAHRLENP